jgi:hypothetical protein
LVNANKAARQNRQAQGEQWRRNMEVHLQHRAVEDQEWRQQLYARLIEVCNTNAQHKQCSEERDQRAEERDQQAKERIDAIMAALNAKKN